MSNHKIQNSMAKNIEFINKIIYRGRVGRNDVKSFGDKACAKMSVATQRAYTSADGFPVMETTWINVTAFESERVSAETLRKISKGDWVEVEGRIRAVRFTDAAGVDRIMHEIVANDVKLLDNNN